MTNEILNENRPTIHFAPEKGWMNDPNGLVYYDEVYHLFYQHIPDALVHSNDLHWGHATSNNLINWEEKDIALYPDKNGTIWSGSIVVDEKNTGNFQSGKDKALVAIYTQAIDTVQTQSIAFSNDKGNTWTAYDNNPVIRNTEIKDFRDPKVIWNSQKKSWVMVLASGDRILFFGSNDLKNWDKLSEFELVFDSPGIVCECPDMFEMKLENSAEEIRWLLIYSISSGAPNGGSGTKYIIGNFDGVKFIPDTHNGESRWLNYGKDCYAGVTFSNIPANDGRRIFVSWMNNWTYANSIPTSPWRGMMTLPRVINLVKDDRENILVRSLPVDELKNERMDIIEKRSLFDNSSLSFAIKSGRPIECFIDFKIEATGNLEIELSNESGDSLTIRLNKRLNNIQLERSSSQFPNFHPEFASSPIIAPLTGSQFISLRLILDRNSIEVFVEDGLSVISSLVFPQYPYDQLKLNFEIDLVKINHLKMWSLN